MFLDALELLLMTTVLILAHSISLIIHSPLVIMLVSLAEEFSQKKGRAGAAPGSGAEVRGLPANAWPVRRPLGVV